jgi:hypothetical protein
MICAGFLSPVDRADLTALARDGFTSASRYRPCDIWILTLKHKFTSFGNFALVSSSYPSLQR